MSSKTCTKCGQTKSITEFFKLHVTKDGYNTKCKSCVAAYTRQRYLKDRKKIIKRATDRNRKSKYGLSPEQYQEMLKSQNYCCAICNTHLDGSRFGLIGQVDHCHSTGKIRGLLCTQCNTGLGNFYEKEDNLLAAILYLRKNNDEQ